MAKLVFRNSKTLQSLAKKTLAKKEFKVPYEDKYTEQRSFFLVKDEGIYVMNCYKNKDHKKNLVVYASGFNPKTNARCWDDCVDAVGGDDFAESIPLSDEMLTRICEGKSLKVNLTETEIKIEV